MRAIVATPALTLLLLATSSTPAADDPIVRRATWFDSMLASHDAVKQSTDARPGVPPLPLFKPVDHTFMVWIQSTHGGTIVSLAPPSGRWLRGGRAHLMALAAYPVASAMVYWRIPLPRTPGQWGALVVVCAFGAFAGALAVTRLRMGRDDARLFREGGVEGGDS